MSILGKVTAFTLALILTAGSTGLEPALTHAKSPQAATVHSSTTLQLKNRFDAQQINQRTQQKLIDKLRRGKVIDSMNPQKVEAVRNKITPTLNRPQRSYTFADGSKIASGMTIISQSGTLNGELNTKDPLLANKSATVKKKHNSGKRQLITAKIWYMGGLINCSFYATFVLVKGGKDYITKVSRPNFTCFGYSVSSKRLRMVRKYENSAGRAKAQLSGKVHIKGIHRYSYTINLSLYVGDNAYATTFSS
ncbi:MAG: hypothetical protein LKI94_03405 [Sporolactobacillus sp.]|jgi:hypothetical protein|nr:hypothetical protein [Sporolactobacillus sp.]